MKNLLRALIFAATLVGFAPLANAASCTWNNGAATGLWNNAGNWSCARVPIAGDNIILDATSAANLTMDVNSAALTTIVISAYTGTFDLNGHTLTGTNFTDGQTGAHTLACTGGGTITVTNTGTNVINISGTLATYSCAPVINVIPSGTLVSSATVNLGGKTVGATTLDYPATFSRFAIILGTGGTMASLTLTGPGVFQAAVGTTYTVTGALTINGSSATSLAYFGQTLTSSTSPVITVGSLSTSFVALCGLSINNAGPLTANNALDFGGNANGGGGTLIINPPSGGGGFIIGG